MRPDDHLHLRGPPREPTVEQLGLALRDEAGRSEPGHGPPGGVEAEPAQELLPGGRWGKGEERVEPRRADSLDGGRVETVQLGRLASLDVVPDEERVGVLVDECLAREVVPAVNGGPDGDTGGARRGDDPAFLPGEVDSAQDQHGVEPARFEEAHERSVRRDESLDRLEGRVDRAQIVVGQVEAGWLECRPNAWPSLA